jgi:hypothetical protein
MTKLKTGILVAAAAFGGMIIGQAQPVQAQLGGIIKGGAIVLLIDKFGGEINKFVNRLTGGGSANTAEATKVVPILSAGQGVYAGAAQISGPKSQVDQVRAIAQIEGKTKIGGEVRIKALIPVSTRDVKDQGKLTRIKGVGVSALLDLRL